MTNFDEGQHTWGQAVDLHSGLLFIKSALYEILVVRGEKELNEHAVAELTGVVPLLEHLTADADKLSDSVSRLCALAHLAIEHGLEPRHRPGS